MKIRPLDGAHLEGGGQLVRLSVCLSALTGRPIHIRDIRGNRDGGGGLKEQHLSSVRWLAAACDADVEGMEIKSKSLKFMPGSRRDQWWEHAAIERDGKSLRIRRAEVNLATSGAVTLVLQALLPFLLFAGAETEDATPSATQESLQSGIGRLSLEANTHASSKQPAPTPAPILLTVRGGTNVSNSPSIDYLTQVILPNFKLLGLPHIELLNDQKDHKLKRDWARGTRPSRSSTSHLGTTSFLINPIPYGTTLPAKQIPKRRGRITKIDITILAPGDLQDSMQTRCIELVQSRLCKVSPSAGNDEIVEPPEIEIVLNEATQHPAHMHVLLVAHTSSGYRLGADCLFSEKVGKSLPAQRDAALKLVDKAVRVLEGELVEPRPTGDGDAGAEGTYCLDEWMQDQVVVFQALASGQSGVADGTGAGVGEGRKIMDKGKGRMKEASLHTRTVRWVAGELLGVEFDDGGACKGVGYAAGVGIPTGR